MSIVSCQLTQATFLILAGLALISLNMPAVGWQDRSISALLHVSFGHQQASPKNSHSSGKGWKEASILARALVQPLCTSYFLISYCLNQVQLSWSRWGLQSYRAKDMELVWSEELQLAPAISLPQNLPV